MTLQQLRMLFPLFWTFFRIGPATFGGGYAMISLIEHETVTKRGWLDEQELSDLVSIAGSAPGGVGVNAAAFIGYRLAGIAGAVISIIGITLPTFLIVLGLSYLYVHMDGNPKVVAAMQGIQAAVIALIASAAYRMAKTSLFDLSTIMIAIATLLVLIFTEINPIYAILAGLLIGIINITAKMYLGLKVTTEKATPQKQEDRDYLEYYI
ncbi:chromate transporter [Paenibacillus sp. NPDC057967]|uniref:chromate transporter n=1 Tax=Paenibacillus sp. NPDC057967 TaxID=3346293 RepID=UPI0036D8EE46